MELDQIAKVDHGDIFVGTVMQQAYIQLHEVRHVATKSKHNTSSEYASWLKGLFDNCFKKEN